jgi:hypothetical protein
MLNHKFYTSISVGIVTYLAVANTGLYLIYILDRETDVTTQPLQQLQIPLTDFDISRV